MSARRDPSPGGRPRCAFCGRARGESSYLSGGEGWFHVCLGCVYEARAVGGRGPGRRPRRCSFCGTEAKRAGWIFGGSKVAICDACVGRCVEEIEAG